MNPPSFHQQQRGVTLVELVVCIILLGIAASAMLTAFGNMMASSADPLWHNKSLKLGQLYLDEILAKAYDETTPLGGLPAATTIDCSALGEDDGTGPNDEIDERGDRTLYDDVDDYNMAAYDRPVSLISSLDSSYDDYRVQVTVTCDGGSVGASGNEHAKRITVSVRAPNQDPAKPMVFSVYKGNY